MEKAAADHLSWLKRVHQCLFFSDKVKILPMPAAHGLSNWAAAAETAEDRTVRQAFVEQLRQSRQTMNAQAAVLTSQVAEGRQVEHDDYDAFMAGVESYCQNLRHLECLLRQSLTETDPLTGVHNRQGMLRDLNREWTRSLRSGEPCCLALADLDRFKDINDTYGHLAGDRVLLLAARFFRRRLRPYDLVYRFGGEEFLFCLPNTDAPKARRVLDRLRTLMARLPVRLDDGRRAVVTASIGVAEMRPDTPPEAAIARADRAVYQAKSLGRNRVCLDGEYAAGPMMAATPRATDADNRPPLA